MSQELKQTHDAYEPDMKACLVSGKRWHIDIYKDGAVFINGQEYQRVIES